MNLVEITAAGHGVLFDLAYTGADNFTGQPVYQRAACYLHVDADLVHFRRAPVGSEVDATQFRMQQSRRLRSKEVHYIDHPLFGLIVLITPYEPAEIFSEEHAQSSE